MDGDRPLPVRWRIEDGIIGGEKGTSHGTCEDGGKSF